MYYAINEGKKIPVGDRPCWVKMQTNGIMVLCHESEGQGIIIDGEVYHVDGRPELDKPTVDIIWEDDTKKLVEAVGLGVGENKDHGAALACAVRFSKILLKQSLPDLTDAEILACGALLDDWEPNAYEVNDARNHGGQVWRCRRAHNSAESDTDIVPGEEKGEEFWTPYRAAEVTIAKNNMNAASDPKQTDNDYRKGSLWFNMTTGSLFVCTNVGTEATWQKVTVGFGG